MQRRRPVMLVILDGWGWRDDPADNAIRQAKTPTFDRLWRDGPHGFLRTSGHDVGLPDGQMGNSEVGHLNIGAGRVVMQDLPRIGGAIANGDIKRAPALTDLIAKLKDSGGTCHLIGLVSPGGVHSHQDHAAALAKILADAGVPTLLHAFTDGRDTPPQSAGEDIKRLIAALPKSVAIATVCGRYYAMDRDKRWERVAKAYNVIVEADGPRFADAPAVVADAYANKKFDEFVLPAVVGDYRGMKDGDGVLCFNFRADRVRQITRVLARNSGLTKDDGKELPGAEDLDRTIPRVEVPKQLHYVCMTQYDKQFSLPIVILPESMENLLADMLAQANLRNLRIAETEKYAHVTYFFNGGIEKPFAGEDRVLVPSQKVATYDLAPEMSAGGIADAVIKAIGDPAFDLVVVNFANADMVGHSGKLEPTIQGVETIDVCLGRIVADQDYRHRVGGMRGVRPPRSRIDHQLGVAVVGGDQHRSAPLLESLVDTPQAGINRLHSLNRRLDFA